VNLATANEMRRVEDDEIEQIYRDLIASRSVDGGGTI
jgi:hypothetical protein